VLDLAGGRPISLRRGYHRFPPLLPSLSSCGRRSRPPPLPPRLLVSPRPLLPPQQLEEGRGPKGVGDDHRLLRREEGAGRDQQPQREEGRGPGPATATG
jgi:hypothetical protein